MANPQLSVEITAKIDALRDGFNQAIKETGKWDAATKKALADVDKGFVKLATDVERSSNTVSKSLAKAAMTTATSGKAISVGSNQAAFALQNLGRVAQDAPFGFIGIQNNLNPLLESFQRLRVESGSNAAAFKSLGQSLIGPAGIGIALSVVSAAVLFYQQYQQRANKATENAKKVTDDYVKTLDAVTGAQLKGSQNAQKELTDLRLLFSAYQNANLPLKQRKENYEELQKQYPSYFGNLKFEETASLKTKAAYDQLTNSIIATARARAAGDKITQNESRKLENEQKVIDLQKDRLKTETELQKIRQRSDAQISGGATGGVSGNVSDLSRVNEVQGRINENIKATNNLRTDSNKLTAENNRLVTFVNTQLEQGAKITGSIGGEAIKAGKDVKTLAEIMAQLRLEIKLNEGQLDKTFGEKGLANLDSYQKAIDELTKIGFAQQSKEIQNLVSQYDALAKVLRGGSLDASGLNLTPQIRNTDPIDLSNKVVAKFEIPKGLNEYQKLVRQSVEANIAFEESLRSLSVSTISSGLSDAFGAIGQSLAEGTNAIDAFGSALLSAFAGFLSQLGQMFIKEGIAQIGYGIAKNLILPGSGAGNITGGLGMIAAGGIISAVGGAAGAKRGKKQSDSVPQVRGFATGGYNLPGGMALVGERGPELVNLPTGASVNNNMKTNRIIADANKGTVVLNGDLDVGLDKLYLRLRAVGKKLERSGL